MDILLENGDLMFENLDIVLKNSVLQKISIRLRWFFQEWRWNDKAGVDYFEYLFKKNPDIVQITEMVREVIFNVEEVTDVINLEISSDPVTRTALIYFEVTTDEETLREEVNIYG